MTKKGTKDRKIVVDGTTTYIFRVAESCSLEPWDIIDSGRMVLIKEGAKPSVDVFGNLLGNSARAWNPQTAIKIISNDVSVAKLAAAYKRNLQLQLHEKNQNVENAMTKPNATHWSGKTILFEKEPVPRYFTSSFSICANCKEPIHGTQTLEINRAGKVDKVGPFLPNEDMNAVRAGEMTKKWMHGVCAPVTIPVEPPAMQDPPVTEEEHSEDMREAILEILINEEKYTAEFARGAAYMYIELVTRPQAKQCSTP